MNGIGWIRVEKERKETIFKKCGGGRFGGQIEMKAITLRKDNRQGLKNSSNKSTDKQVAKTGDKGILQKGFEGQVITKNKRKF